MLGKVRIQQLVLGADLGQEGRSIFPELRDGVVAEVRADAGDQKSSLKHDAVLALPSKS